MFVYLVVQVAQVSSAAYGSFSKTAPSDNVTTGGSHEENRALLQSEQHDEAKPEVETLP